MPTHINSALRLHQVLSAACAEAGNEAMFQVLAKAFSIQNLSGHDMAFEVSRMLRLLYFEIGKAKQQMQASGFSSDLYAPALANLEEHLNPTQLFTAWPPHRDYVNGTLYTLKFCSEVLPHEEELIAEEELQSMQEILRDLEARLDKGELSEPAKAFIRRHIELIRRAIRDYRVIGRKAFDTAVYEGFVDYKKNEEIVVENHDKEEFSMLGKVWTGVKKAANLTVKAEKLLTAGVKLYELGDKTVDVIDKLT